MHDEYPFRAASVFQTRRKISGDGSAAQEAMDEINALVRERGSWDGSRFDWVGVVINVVATPEEVPSEPLVRRISKGELPVVVDVDVESLRGLEHAHLVVAFKRLMLRGLVAGLRAKGQDASFAEAALSGSVTPKCRSSRPAGGRVDRSSRRTSRSRFPDQRCGERCNRATSSDAVAR